MKKSVETINAKIYVGLREGYSDIVHSLGELEKVLQNYTNKKGMCVTITPTRYIYTNQSFN